MKSALSEVRRARPLLGTFVEITAQGSDERKLHRAIDKAFAAVCQVHRLMSFHDPKSDVSHMNRDAFPRSVIVHPWTWQVLKAALAFSRESDGAFDITVARLLARWNYLPRFDYHFNTRSIWRDIFLRKNCRVFFRRRVIVDLGGIAKGFAVDRAVEALIAAGVRSGIVNAGGDLRVFGPEPRVVHVRHAREPARIGRIVLLRETSLATSALYYTRRDLDQKSPLVDGRTHRPALDDVSVSVYAPDCITADALTKVVFAMRDDARLILDRYGAGSFLLSSNFPFCELSN
jgi:thiamine biosynthesis lipoprotein